MESHKEPLAEVGVETGDISAPDLCLVGVYPGEVGDINIGMQCSFHAGVKTPHCHTLVRGQQFRVIREVFAQSSKPFAVDYMLPVRTILEATLCATQFDA